MLNIRRRCRVWLVGYGRKAALLVFFGERNVMHCRQGSNMCQWGGKLIKEVESIVVELVDAIIGGKQQN